MPAYMIINADIKDPVKFAQAIRRALSREGRPSRDSRRHLARRQIGSLRMAHARRGACLLAFA